MIENLIVIPYRDRKRHLDLFISNTLPLLKEELPSVRLVIIEQEDGNLFNRGALINIGHHLYRKKAKSIITHDVDLYPTRECIKKYYAKKINGIHGICCSPCNTLGGIVKISMSHFAHINGFPNNFWGWGVEDKAFQNRAEHHNVKIEKSVLRNRGNFLKYFYSDEADHSRKKDSSKYTKRHKVHFDKWSKLSTQRQKKLTHASGVNNLKYKIINRLSSDEYDHFVVEIIKTEEDLSAFLKRKIIALSRSVWGIRSKVQAK